MILAFNVSMFYLYCCVDSGKMFVMFILQMDRFAVIEFVDKSVALISTKWIFKDATNEREVLTLPA